MSIHTHVVLHRTSEAAVRRLRNLPVDREVHATAGDAWAAYKAWAAHLGSRPDPREWVVVPQITYRSSGDVDRRSPDAVLLWGAAVGAELLDLQERHRARDDAPEVCACGRPVRLDRTRIGRWLRGCDAVHALAAVLDDADRWTANLHAEVENLRSPARERDPGRGS
jgi:hypothetical protein